MVLAEQVNTKDMSVDEALSSLEAESVGPSALEAAQRLAACGVK